MAQQSQKELLRTLTRTRSRSSISEESLAERHREAQQAASTVIVQDVLKRHYFYACRMARLRCSALVEMRAALLKCSKKAKLLVVHVIRKVRHLLSCDLRIQSGLSEDDLLASLSAVRNTYKQNSALLNEQFNKESPMPEIFFRPTLLEGWKLEEKALFKVAFDGLDMGTWR
jgi:hypothetical protein